MKRIIILASILLISLCSFSQGAWTVRIDTVVTNQDTVFKHYSSFVQYRESGMVLQNYLFKYKKINDTLRMVGQKEWKYVRRNEDTIPVVNKTIQWLKDETFVKRNYIKTWFDIELDNDPKYGIR